MEKQTRNVITRKSVEKELRFYNTADIKSSLVLGGGLSLVFLPLTVGIVYGICSSYQNILIEVALSVLCGSITSSPVWISLLGVCRALFEKKRLLRGDFDIVACDVSYKSEKMVKRHMEEYLHFGNFNAISVGHTVYQLASAGDTFYIVHYKGKKDIKLFYSAKMYEFQ